MPEQFDIYNARKERTGEFGTRGVALAAGQFRFVGHVIIFDSTCEKVLIQKRREDKEAWPGYWDFTAGGSAIAGEEIYQAAERELFEEVGLKLDLSNTASRLTLSFHEGWDEVYLVKQDVELTDLVIQAEEVAEVRWVTEEELRQLISTGRFVRSIYNDVIFELARTDEATL
ncbi:MAG: NUDIX domain-containing protein [Streptococcaceae bacterium]|nr:NUDIX domain-containing protein [Streptococcaceae bacterium]